MFFAIASSSAIVRISGSYSSVCVLYSVASNASFFFPFRSYEYSPAPFGVLILLYLLAGKKFEMLSPNLSFIILSLSNSYSYRCLI